MGRARFGCVVDDAGDGIIEGHLGGDREQIDLRYRRPMGRFGP